ncbi:hypothetical protein JL101_023025 [Skermanella rosea]|uniref:hypothetical protein n=1 Tax=Skermanella rosea TaxID=1817965 RepID=UPI001932ED13|nr:hypothetical protein [Skermanella rosea]UEM02818.1 hypothetical protein JL101_023025 [Skermanella rosea]
MPTTDRFIALAQACVWLSVAGCAAHLPDTAEDTPPPVAVDRKACLEDTVRLSAKVDVLDAPSPAAAMVTKLHPDQPIHLCGESGAYQAVMFARPGEPNDCSRREADVRASLPPCPTGWVSAPVPRDLFG